MPTRTTEEKTAHRPRLLGTLTVLAGCVLSLLGTSEAHASNFASTCSQIRLQNTSQLRATCRRPNGLFTDAILELNGFITNRRGFLAFSGEGGFRGSCQEVRLENNEGLTSVNVTKTFLRAACRNTTGGIEQTRIDLNQIISNVNGLMRPD